MIDRKNFFDQPVKNNLKTYYNIQKIAISQGDDCTTGYLQDYKQQALDADPKAIQQIKI